MGSPLRILFYLASARREMLPYQYLVVAIAELSERSSKFGLKDTPLWSFCTP